MTATSTLHPSGRRTGATWVAATGAFLLLAGATVFVGVQWDRLSEPAKLALVGALTAAFLAGGRVLRRTLPATGDVVFHLGAFLLPVDLAGVGLRSGMGWRPLLVAEGVLGAVVLGGLGLASGSIVLSWAGAASVAVLAAGVASVSPVAAPLVLVAAAVAAEASGHRRLQALAWPWAAAAGLAPVLGPAVTLVLGLGDGTMADLGLVGNGATVSVLSGALAAAVLARQARRHEDLRLAILALACVTVGLVSGWAGAALPLSAAAVGVAALFVAVELAAVLAVRDPFWSRPMSNLAEMAEVPATAVSVYAGILLLAAPFADRFAARPDWAAALALMALGFLTADLRRYRGTPRPFGLTLLRGGSWAPATVPLALTAVAAIEVGTASAPATAAALLVVAALAAFSGRPWSEAVVAGFAPWAVVTVAGSSGVAAVVGLAGAALVAETAVRRTRQTGPTAVEPALAAVAAVTNLLGLAVASRTLGPGVTAAAAAPACWLLAVQLERGGRRLADLARLALLAPVLAALYLSPAQGVPVLLAAAGLYAADAVRLGRPEVGAGAALAVQALVAQVALGAGVTGPAVGLALGVAAVVWAGLAVVADAEWRLPFLVGAGTGLVVGLSVASGDPATFANTLLIAGGLAVSAGLAGRRPSVAHGGGVLCTVAIAIHLATAGVGASEPYLAPVATQLLVAGWTSRRHRPAPSSWAAYVPAIALLGGAALLERLAGGAGWHALLAGTVATAAVAAGGGRRLAGPMLAGTALLVAVTVHESLGALAGVPTWAWLTLGGSVLLGTGVALERNDTSPVEAGRRIVDVVAERFG
ncbi:MAG: SCO7613 C-terminal domain-containing membrane protein [Acidimicrobiales bacterium]